MQLIFFFSSFYTTTISDFLYFVGFEMMLNQSWCFSVSAVIRTVRTISTPYSFGYCYGLWAARSNGVQFLVTVMSTPLPFMW
ncbi:hypothetical protein RIF29_10377 [Crotalaria pallida]|uniref:Uncharacterized protein n=1 Tax=Crotalaria pallida TaxID=3830 RepID=A0AAN9FVP5_CROPI